MESSSVAVAQLAQDVIAYALRWEWELDNLLAKKEKELHEWHLKVFHGFFSAHLTQLIPLAELRQTFNLMKKLPICGGCKDHFDFQASVVKYLKKVCHRKTTDDICKWIESEYAKLAPRGVLHNFAFIRALFAAVIHVSLHFTGFRTGIIELDQMVFRRWALVLHRFTTEHNVAASQILLFVAQDYAAVKRHPKCVLSDILSVLSENDKFLSYIDKDGVNYTQDHWHVTIMNCLLFNAERYPEACA